jgi:SAM-dependent methyltransferase
MTEDPRIRIVADGYDRLAERYRGWASATGPDPRDAVLTTFIENLPNGARVLDLGCGSGQTSTARLATRFRVTGVDLSATQIKLARRHVPDAAFIHGDFTRLEFADASFDGITAFYSISHVPRERHGRLFGTIHRWLAPGGLFLATLGARDSPDWTGPWLGDVMFFSSHGADENRRLLRMAGFELLLDEVRVTAEPDGDVPFLWVIARRSAAEASPV